MFIENISDYLQKLTKRDIKPEIFTVFEFPDDLTILEILNSIGYRLANLFGYVKINTTTETTDETEADVKVTGNVDNLNFDFKIPRGKDGAPGVAVSVGTTTTAPAGSQASVTNSGTESHPVLNFNIPKGDTGAQGPKGETGASGPQGEQGPQGPKGDRGATGLTGATGPQGPQGETGPQGPKGDTGDTGPKGEPGVSVKVGTTTTGASGTSANVTNSGTTSDPILNFTIPRGDRGEQGPTGPQGPQGEQGETGPAGPQGPQGPKGDSGTNVTIITATASTTTQGEYTPDTSFTSALEAINSNQVVCIKLENLAGRFYVPYSSSNTEILASAGTVSGSNQSIELYTIRWAADTNVISITGTKEGCIADGGTTGQVLVKKSDDSFDTEWTNNVTVLKTPLTQTQEELITLFNKSALFIIDSIYLYSISVSASNSLYGFCIVERSSNSHVIRRCNISNGVFRTALLTFYDVPTGGKTGQVLAKKTDANGDVEWKTVESGGDTNVVRLYYSNDKIYTDEALTSEATYSIIKEHLDNKKEVKLLYVYFDTNYWLTVTDYVTGGLIRFTSESLDNYLNGFAAIVTIGTANTVNHYNKGFSIITNNFATEGQFVVYKNGTFTNNSVSIPNKFTVWSNTNTESFTSQQIAFDESIALGGTVYITFIVANSGTYNGMVQTVAYDLASIQDQPKTVLLSAPNGYRTFLLDTLDSATFSGGFNTTTNTTDNTIIVPIKVTFRPK